MKPAITLQRRQMLAASAAGLGALGLGALATQAQAQGAGAPATKTLPPLAGWKDPKAMIVHSSNTVETRRAAYGTSVITPTNRLFVRNNLPAPDASILDQRDAWSVAFEGVKNPRSLTVADLKTLGVETVATVLQCSGNGRGFFPSKPSGTPWQVGAAGCVLWSGVPLRTVIHVLGGAQDGMAYLTGTGGEKLPEGVDPLTVLVERSVPLKALEDALLAWEMNGEPLSLAHGGPLRLIVPGYQGVNNVKYVKRIALMREQSTARIMASRYRMVPPGAKGNPGLPSVWEMVVKSWINGPLSEEGTLRAGWTQIHGVAFAGTREVRGVEVSTDGGKSWQQAQFVGPDLGRFAWRQFVLPVQLAAGTHVLASRATDAAGNAQPRERVENSSGYNNNSWLDHAVTVTVA